MEAKSTMRFCSIRENSSNPNKLRCKFFEVDRPFNGLNVAARRHRLCNAWSEQHTTRPICTEKVGTLGDVQSCEGFDNSKLSEPIKHKLYCSFVDEKKSIDFIGSVKPRRIYGLSSSLTIITQLPAEERGGQAVVGIYSIQGR